MMAAVVAMADAVVVVVAMVAVDAMVDAAKVVAVAVAVVIMPCPAKGIMTEGGGAGEVK